MSTLQVLASASTGTFLLCLGLDLIVNKQSGMSRGLRFLFDRNVSHLLVSSEYLNFPIGGHITDATGPFHRWLQTTSLNSSHPGDIPRSNVRLIHQHSSLLVSSFIYSSPFLAYIQHRVFKHPFSRKPRPDSAISYLNPMEHTKAVDLKASQVAFPARVSRGSAYLGPSRFSL